MTILVMVLCSHWQGEGKRVSGTYWTRLSQENYKGIGLRENEVDEGAGTHKSRKGVADHKYF